MEGLIEFKPRWRFVSYWLELISPNTLPHGITTISRWVTPDFDIGVLIELIFFSLCIANLKELYFYLNWLCMVLEFKNIGLIDF